MSTTIGRSTSALFLGFCFLGVVAALAFALVFLHLSPAIILILLVGGMTVAISAFRPYIGVHVIIGMIFFEGAATVSTDVTGLRIFGVLLLGGWLAKAMAERRLRIEVGPHLVLLLAYLAWCGICITRATYFDDAVTRLGTNCLLAITAVMITSVVDTVDRLRRLLVGVVLWISLSAAIALVMYYAGSTVVAEGLVKNRNLLALYLNIGLAGAFLLQRWVRSAIVRIALVLCIPLLLLTIALTLSRTGLIVMAVTLAIVGYQLLRQRGIFLPLGGAIAVAALTILVPTAFWSRAGTILPSIERKQDTFGVRVRLWEAGVRMVDDRPIFGVGPGNFRWVLVRYVRGGMSTAQLNAHNAYVVVAAETGVPGLILFLGVIVSSALALRRVARDARQAGRDDLATYTFLAQTMILIVMATGIMMTVETLKILWVVLGLGWAVAALGRMELAAAAAVPRDTLPAPAGAAPA